MQLTNLNSGLLMPTKDPIHLRLDRIPEIIMGIF